MDGNCAGGLSDNREAGGKMRSIEEQLSDFAKTDKFKKLVAEKIRDDVRSGASARDKWLTLEDVDGYAIELKNYVYEFMKEKIPEFADYFIQNFEKIDYTTDETNGQLHFVIDFAFSSTLHRESLAPYLYPNGVNIGRLFNTGYFARRPIWGYWQSHDTYIWSRQARDGLHYLENAVEAFNSHHGGNIRAEYHNVW